MLSAENGSHAANIGASSCEDSTAPGDIQVIAAEIRTPIPVPASPAAVACDPDLPVISPRLCRRKSQSMQ